MKFPKVKFAAYIEMCLFFLLTTLIAWIYDLPLNFSNTALHPFWIAVLLMSAQYGTKEGLIAALVSSVLFLLGPLPVHNVLQDQFEYFFTVMKLPILWFIFATILGEIAMRRIRQNRDLQKQVQESEQKEKTIAESYEGLKKIKEHLEMRVVSNIQTTCMMIESIQQLQNPEEVIQGAQHLIQALISPKKFSIFLFKDSLLSCAATQGWEEKEVFSKTITPESLLYQEVFLQNNSISLLTHPNTLAQEGLLAVPILDKNSSKTLGIIKVEEIPFLHITTLNLMLLRTIGSWLGTALNKKSGG